MDIPESRIKFMLGGLAVLFVLIIVTLYLLLDKKEEKTLEQMNGYNFTWEEEHGDVKSRTSAWVFLDTKTATVEQNDTVNNRFLQDNKQKYSVKLTDNQLSLIFDIYQEKTVDGRTGNTPYDQAVINALNIIKNGEPDEATKELKFILDRT